MADINAILTEVNLAREAGMTVTTLIIALSIGMLGFSVREQPRAVTDHLDPLVTDVVETYAKLGHSQSRADFLSSYGALSSSMKSALWVYQFRVALQEHPEFTDEQRKVLEDAIATFTPDMFAISAADPAWSERVDQPLQMLMQRAKTAFGNALGMQLFAHLGPMTRPAARMETAALRPTPNDTLPPCECSTTSDYCAWELGSDYACVGGGCFWGMNWGCGTGLQYRCNGMCHLQYGGG